MAKKNNQKTANDTKSDSERSSRPFASFQSSQVSFKIHPKRPFPRPGSSGLCFSGSSTFVASVQVKNGTGWVLGAKPAKQEVKSSNLLLASYNDLVLCRLYKSTRCAWTGHTNGPATKHKSALFSISSLLQKSLLSEAHPAI